MDLNKSPNSRTKRLSKVLEYYWDCSVCTYRNTAEAFKCLMCDIRKGTSTRKPKINPELAAQQAAPNLSPNNKSPKKEESKEISLKRRNMDDDRLEDDKPAKKSWQPPRLKNIDRSTGQAREVTVNNVTVVITEYKAKKKKEDSDTSSTSSDDSLSDATGDLTTDSCSS